MDKNQKIFKLSERKRKHNLKRKRIIEDRLKSFGQKSIPSIFKKVEKKPEPELKEKLISKEKWYKRFWKYLLNILKGRTKNKS